MQTAYRHTQALDQSKTYQFFHRTILTICLLLFLLHHHQLYKTFTHSTNKKQQKAAAFYCSL